MQQKGMFKVPSLAAHYLNILALSEAHGARRSRGILNAATAKGLTCFLRIAFPFCDEFFQVKSRVFWIGYGCRGKASISCERHSRKEQKATGKLTDQDEQDNKIEATN